MRNAVPLLVALGLLACTDRAPTENNYEMRRTAPPTLSVSATTRVLPVAGGAPDLEISASLRNSTVSHIQVAVGAQCPLFVRIFPDPTGEYSGSLDPSMACAQGGPILDLAPGDTAVLTRVLRADTLASFAPGTYGINVAVTTTTDLIGVWAGAVQLPPELGR
ncbi:MAG TPA: hypothetical protein VHE82_12070 [Gemmatimonadaceae bacterium]|nr:hypothetical protein [Gemmatimonadaceae bacterium]